MSENMQRRDRLAYMRLLEQHDHDWYIGDATTAEWEAAYEWADALAGTDDGASSTDGCDQRHPHERWDGPTIPRTLDDEGRCLVCGLLVNLEAAEARAERAESALTQAQAREERLREALANCTNPSIWRAKWVKEPVAIREARAALASVPDKET